MNDPNQKDYERLGLKISMAGSILLSTSAIVMALLSHSQAVLLDGLYTLVTLLLAFLSLKVIDLIRRPETRTRPFGYTNLEPFTNLAKSLLMLLLLLVFMVTNIQELCSGGRIIALDMTSVYILSCLVIYLAVLTLLRRCGAHSNSSILNLEIRNWHIDAMLTIGIAAALITTNLLIQAGWVEILPYIDPSIVIVLVLLSLPVPLQVLHTEIKRLLLISPENRIEEQVQQALRPVAEQYGLIHIQVWGLKNGRSHYLFIYSDLKEDHTTITRLDEIRREMFRALTGLYPVFWADILFTRIDPEKPFPPLPPAAPTPQ